MHAITFISYLFLGLATPQDRALDIDTFMEKVLERRDINWDDFYNYTCRERETLEVEGSLEAVPMQGFLRENMWFVRDGYLVRSPLSINGVKISRKDRDQAERKWIERVKKREEKEGVDRDRFFGFKFEPGNYYFAGRQEFEGREVVAVEYYPETFFSDEEDEKRPRGRGNRKKAQQGLPHYHAHRSRGAPDRPDDYRQRGLRFSSGGLADSDRYHRGLDDHAPAVWRHLAP